MMQRIRFIALPLTAAVLLAATCVTETRQRGAAGPWVGEVVNYGREPVSAANVAAEIFDATGAPLGRQYVSTCPRTIAAGGRGTFELFTGIASGATLPLRAEFAPVVLPGGSGGETGEGLTARLVSADGAKRAAIVEVTNASPQTMGNLQVCGNLRGTAGALLEVGSAPLFPTVLRPGQSQTVPIFFNSIPPGDFEFFAQGQCCAPSVIFEPSQFNVSTSRITHGPTGRALVVAGELRNQSGQDLSWVRLVAYVDGAPATRVTAALGCDGEVGFGQPAAATFAIPLDAAGSQPNLVIAGVEGTPAGSKYSVPASGVTMAPLPDQPDGLGTVAVSATLHNPTSQWVGVERACATVRDGGGNVVGVVPLLAHDGSAYGYPPLIAPGARVVVAGAGYVVGAAASADVRAFGALRDRGPVAGAGSP
ncbi:MAG TPA: FxLYD domain-containing protein [Dehalococcoidia bacterium]|nr:FxLYD domain-containing protein [Dehalococcoidia bacterium]